MKYGFIWFLHLDKVIQFARIAVIPCLVWGFLAKIHSIFFALSWVLFFVSLLITLCTFFMHIPSTEKVEKAISQCERDFVEKQKTDFCKHRNVEILELKCFAANKGMRLCRKINERKIYDTLCMLAWVQTNEGLWLAYEEKPLWIDAPSNRGCYEIKNSEEFQVFKSPAGLGEVKLSFEIERDSFCVSCRDDYHCRDFINKYNISVIEKEEHF